MDKINLGEGGPHKENLILETAGASEVGLVRESNEDYYAVDRERGLFIVADGLGGRSGGEVASKLAVDSIASLLKKYLKVEREDSFAQSINKAIKETHEVVLKKSNSSPLLKGMGTTIVLALFKSPRDLYIANVGDSRGYLYRDNKFQLLSKDHSLVAELVEQGKITEEEARSHCQRNIVTQVIGIEPLTECFQKKVELEEKDIILLCSDGLWDMLTDKEIEGIIAKNGSPQKLCHDLVSAAKTAGGEDNITVIVAKAEER